MIDLDAIEAAEKAMTPGELEAVCDRDGYAIRVKGGKAVTGWGRVVQTRGDAEGFALLRNSAPALFAELRHLRAENAGLRKLAVDCAVSIGRAKGIAYAHGLDLAGESLRAAAEKLLAASKGGET